MLRKISPKEVNKNKMTKIFSSKTLSAMILLVLVAVGQSFGQAQAGSGQITGVVTDSNGAVVPSASLTLISKSTNETKTSTTGGDGTYRFVLLQPDRKSVV